ncbi:hypothetical protein OCU04_002580 [Sclerotinia nivalis]|uniref:Secreted protein n=1 Tax=Sclerotinia nivalis TaxID=352851 RepID=A0A9X0DQC1_9HELO|nr:hypothetical protein OCU04_002580 [Sclerotinia nivalis]
MFLFLWGVLLHCFSSAFLGTGTLRRYPAETFGFNFTTLSHTHTHTTSSKFLPPGLSFFALSKSSRGSYMVGGGKEENKDKGRSDELRSRQSFSQYIVCGI